MPQKKKRVEIPRDIEAQVQFLSDRTCCVCRVRGKPFQIHHIDENPANNEPNNLAVLCLECHNETQIRGGFGRKLNADQIILYRDDWLIQVSKARPAHFDRLSSTPTAIPATPTATVTEIRRLHIHLSQEFPPNPYGFRCSNTTLLAFYISNAGNVRSYIRSVGLKAVIDGESRTVICEISNRSFPTNLRLKEEPPLEPGQGRPYLVHAPSLSAQLQMYGENIVLSE